MNAQVQPATGTASKRVPKLSKEALFEDNGSLLSLELTYADGTTRSVMPPAALLPQAAAFGFLAKLGGLGEAGEDLSALKAEVEDLIAQWNRGEWRQRAEGGSGTSIIQKALMEYRGKTANEIRDFLATKTMQQKEDMKRIPGLAPIVARLEAEAAAKALAKGKVTVPGEDMLAGL